MKSLRAKIAQQTLKLLTTYEWQSISIDMICKKLKLNKKRISRNFQNKDDLLKNINKYFDDFILIETKLLEKSTPRDMIFEIFMLRFDLLNSYRSSMLKIFKVFKRHPNHFIILMPSLISSVEKMAKLANIVTRGIIGRMKLKGLIIIYFSTFLTWVNDDNSELDKTMKTLDSYLEKAEFALKLLKKQNG